MKTFAERLTNILKENNIPKTTLAKEIGISRQAVYDYCNDRTEPSMDVLKKICVYLNESADYFLGLEN